jgi:hypothetical protein
VQNADKANLRAQAFGVGRNFEHGGGAGSEEQIVKNPSVAQTQRVQLLRQSKYDMEIGNLEQFLLSRGEPALTSLCLALRAVPISTGVIGDGLMTAVGTLIDVPSQSRCAAAGDSPQYAQLLKVKPGTLIHEAVALLVE